MLRAIEPTRYHQQSFFLPKMIYTLAHELNSIMKSWEERFVYFYKIQEDPNVAKLKFLCWINTLDVV